MRLDPERKEQAKSWAYIIVGCILFMPIAALVYLLWTAGYSICIFATALMKPIDKASTAFFNWSNQV